MVTDALRQACAGYRGTDSEIIADLAEVVSDRDTWGYTKADAISIDLIRCGTGGAGEVCRGCWLAMIDQVYK